MDHPNKQNDTDRHQEELMKTQETDRLIQRLAFSCFKDCVNDFTQEQQTESEKVCVNNCVD